MSDVTAGHGLGVYRQARIRTTAAPALVVAIPSLALSFLVNHAGVIADPHARATSVRLLVVTVTSGLVLAVAFGRFVSNHILKLARDLDRALGAVDQREHERDSAQHE